MDKNPKFQQSSAKTVPADAKKNQDAPNNKLFLKTSRKREPTGASNFSKHEQPRKSNVQKTKSFDKRPKPKGQYHGGPKEDTQVGDMELAEPGSVMVQGSKKQNLNHLLNFHYAPRDVQGGSGMWNYGKSPKGYNKNSNRWLPPIQRHKYNKEQFLQASCQFVVSAKGNYCLHLTDPDSLVDWKYIEQIKVHSSDSLSCPICLCRPVAGKMTRCGHVYCWPCILHYLSLSDKLWSKCPICYEPIQKTDLKSVVEITHNTFNLGDTVTLRLMCRERGSLLAVPVGSQSPTNFFSVSENVSDSVYSKLLIASAKDIMDIIECERVQLDVELMDNQGSAENCYIEQALNDLQKREEELLGQCDFTPAERQNEETSKQQKQLDEMQDISSATEKSMTEENSKSLESLSNNTQAVPGPHKQFFFYQADDGQHVYLHAINVKMLEMHYGSLENSPPIITGKLLEKEGGCQTDDLRRRLRYLCHLPLTCQFEIAEIELKPPIVSEEVLSSFHDQLVLRQKRRKRREREEQKREKKITEEENKRMGKYPTPEVHIDSQRHFPEWQPELLFAEENAQSPTESAASTSIASSPSLSTFEEAVANREPDNTQDPGPSFAEIMRNKSSLAKSKAGWPSVNIAKLRSHPNVAGPSSLLDAHEEMYMSSPSHRQSFGDALAHALEQTRLLDADSKKSDGGGKGKKKKKKNKSTVLFATSMAYPL